MPQVAPATIRDRAARLRAAAAEQRARWLETLVGSRQQVLVERPGDRGHAENFAEVRLTAPRQTGETVNVTIARVEDGKLVA
jgi:threonylcarbamoyladenosine tRNA methylthiotransferase MtaB